MVILLNNKKDNIIRFFMIHSSENFHLRELARLLKISFPWVRKTVLELAKEGVLHIETQRGHTIVQANREDNKYKMIKKSYNLFSLYDSGLVSKLIEGYSHPNAIVVFGSYSIGEDTQNSDIDIAVISTRKQKINYSSFEKKLHRKIKVLELHPKKIEKEFMSTLANGIVLNGYLEI
jgi:predicted nucleotidyltransferase